MGTVIGMTKAKAKEKENKAEIQELLKENKALKESVATLSDEVQRLALENGEFLKAKEDKK